MPDGTVLNLGMGGDVVFDEDIAGIKYPISKVYLGAHGTSNGPVHIGNPLPVIMAPTPLVQAGNATLISANMETTLITFTGGSQTLFLSSIVGSGDMPGEYKLYVGGSVIIDFRTSVTNPSFVLYFGNATPNSAGPISVTFTHYQSGLIAQKTYGTLLGEIR